MPIVRRTRAEIAIEALKVDWRKVKATTDAEIDAQIAADPDTSPVWTDEELANARRVVPWPRAEDIQALRQRTGLTQKQFAARFGFAVETLRNYEQGHRHPTGPARVLLRVIAAEPEAVARALAE